MAARTLDDVQFGYKLEEKVFIRIGWEAAIKFAEGVQNQTNNSTKPETIRPWCKLSACPVNDPICDHEHCNYDKRA